MLDIKFILNNTDLVKNGAKVKNIDINIDKLIELYNQIKSLKQFAEVSQRVKNELSKKIPTLSGDEKNQAVVESKDAGEKIKEHEAKISELTPIYEDLLLRVPQVPSASAPIGKDDSDNVVIKTVGTPRTFDFTPLPHWEILDKNNWWEAEKLPNICGPRTYCLKGECAQLELAIQNFVINKLIEKGFTYINVPSIIKKETVMFAGHFPGSDESIMDNDVFQLNAPEKALAGTAEIILNLLHKDEILNENQLPIMYAGYSPCFRKEAGAHGKDTRGLIRVHQFHKAEQFIFCKPEDSEKMHEFLLNNLEEIMQDLELPYQVIEACTGEMGFNKVKMNDVEAWVPTENKYREMGSCSSIGDFQARRTNTRFRENATGEVKFCHTLNNTAIALPRPIASILENHQTVDGKVKIPTKLQPLMGNKKYIG